MAEVKWIKIVTDIFDDEKILLIETMPEADSIIVIWFKLLTLAGKTNNKGVFMMSNRIPYTEEMLSAIFRRKLTTVRLALDTFEKFGMIEIVNNVITIPNWAKHQTLDQIDQRREYQRTYMAKRREEQKQLTGKTNSKPNSKVNSKTTVNPIEEDKEEDIDKDINILSKDSMSVETDSAILKSEKQIDFTSILTYWNNNSKVKEITSITPKRQKHLIARVKEHGLDAIFKAIDNVRQSSFLKGANNRGWIATFDWVFLPNNFVKVLEGNYNNSLSNKKASDLTVQERVERAHNYMREANK